MVPRAPIPPVFASETHGPVVRGRGHVGRILTSVYESPELLMASWR